MDQLLNLLENGNDGWGSLDSGLAAAASKETQRRQMEAAEMIAAPFLSDVGRKCLQRLRDMTIEQTCFDPSQSANMGFMREGQNSIIRYIEQCVRVATATPPAD